MKKSESGAISPAIIAIIVVVLVGIVASVVITVAIPAANNADTGGSSQIDENATYEDGEYSATGTYVSPGGLQTIDLTVTIENNTIVATTLRGDDATGEAKVYIDQFIDGYKSEVEGKNVNEVELTRVAGSSLTSTGFNDALDDIRQQARS